MEKFVRLTGKACPLLLPNINTDQILPARFLKLPRSPELGRVLFNDLRRNADGNGKAGLPAQSGRSGAMPKSCSAAAISAAARRARPPSTRSTKPASAA